MLLSDAGQATRGPGGDSRRRVEVEEWSSRAQQVNAGEPMEEVVGGERRRRQEIKVEGGQE